MKNRTVLGLCISLSLASTAAAADEMTTCLDASSKGQRFRDTHKLVEAREQLRVCAAAACPRVVQRDCAIWLAEVEKALPTVVLSAKDGRGGDLFDVNVSVDGNALATRLDGQALPMNPGPHTFHFESADGASADRQVLVKEGEQMQAVAVVLGPPVRAQAGTTPAGTSPAAPSSGATSPSIGTAAPDSKGASHPWRTVGWVASGAGVAGLAVGTVFGLVALGDKTSHCTGDLCDPGTSSNVRTWALISDIGWIAGGVLLAGGAALLLFGPSGSEPGATASVKLAPTMLSGGGGAALGGTF
jgi:hypothetical protein